MRAVEPQGLGGDQVDADTAEGRRADRPSSVRDAHPARRDRRPPRVHPHRPRHVAQAQQRVRARYGEVAFPSARLEFHCETPLRPAGRAGDDVERPALRPRQQLARESERLRQVQVVVQAEAHPPIAQDVVDGTLGDATLPQPAGDVAGSERSFAPGELRRYVGDFLLDVRAQHHRPFQLQARVDGRGIEQPLQVRRLRGHVQLRHLAAADARQVGLNELVIAREGGCREAHLGEIEGWNLERGIGTAPCAGELQPRRRQRHQLAQPHRGQREHDILAACGDVGLRVRGRQRNALVAARKGQRRDVGRDCRAQRGLAVGVRFGVRFTRRKPYADRGAAQIVVDERLRLEPAAVDLDACFEVRVFEPRLGMQPLEHLSGRGCVQLEALRVAAAIRREADRLEGRQPGDDYVELGILNGQRQVRGEAAQRIHHRLHRVAVDSNRIAVRRRSIAVELRKVDADHRPHHEQVCHFDLAGEQHRRAQPQFDLVDSAADDLAKVDAHAFQHAPRHRKQAHLQRIPGDPPLRRVRQLAFERCPHQRQVEQCGRQEQRHANQEDERKRQPKRPAKCPASAPLADHR